MSRTDVDPAASGRRATRIERLLGAPAGEEIDVPLDLIVSDDWTTPSLLAPLERLGTERPAAPVVIVHDHTRAPQSYAGEDRARVERLVAVRDAFAHRYGPRSSRDAASSTTYWRSWAACGPACAYSATIRTRPPSARTASRRSPGTRPPSPPPCTRGAW